MNPFQDIEGSRILVTGGAGLIGGHLVHELIGSGFDVTVVDSLVAGSLENLPKVNHAKSLKFVRADLCEAESYASEIRDCDVVFHLATLRKWPLRGDYAASLGLLKALRGVKIRFLSLHSSALVYGNASLVPTPETYGPLKPAMAYEIDKVKCEKLIAKFAAQRRIPAAILRFSNVVGGTSFHGVVRDYVERLLSHPARLRILGDGLQMRSYVHVDDCVNAIEATTKNMGRSVNVYNVASEDAIDMHAVVEAVADELDLQPPKIIYTGAYNTGGGWPGDPRILFPDTRKIRALNWRALKGSKQAIQKAVIGMRQHAKRDGSHPWQSRLPRGGRPRLLEKTHWDKEFAKLHHGRRPPSLQT